MRGGYVQELKKKFLISVNHAIDNFATFVWPIITAYPREDTSYWRWATAKK